MQKDIMSYLFQLLTDLYLWFILRVRTESWIHWNFPNNFPDLEKNLEKWWMVFFSKLQQVLYKSNFRFHQILFNLVLTFAVHYEKSFVLFINYLIIFSLENEIIVWKKIWKKVLNLVPKICMNPVYMCLC